MGSTLNLVMALGLAAASPLAAQDLDITVYRSWHPPNLTVVDGMFRVDPQSFGAGDVCRYVVQLTVIDTAGTPLVKNRWNGRCPLNAAGAREAALETFQFAVVPARYTIEVVVTPEGRPGAGLKASRVLESLPVGTLASDLILAKQAGWVDSTNQAAWHFRRGQLGIRTASEIVATENDTQIAYYLEVYPEVATPMTGRLLGVVKRQDGREMVRVPLQRLEGVKESRPLAGNFSVAGLAPGEYVLETLLELGDTTLRRTHPFRMVDTYTIAAATPAGSAGDAGYFSTLSDEELTRLFDPVVVFLDRRNRDLFERLDSGGRRRFLQQYFGGQEPSVGGAARNDLDVYLERVKKVQESYSERAGETFQPGWRTDRGRVLLLRGEPSSRATRAVTRDGRPPYEIWQYSGTNHVYLFVDEARFGNYRLIYSTDPEQASLPDWNTRIGADAAEDLARMGIRVPRTVPD